MIILIFIIILILGIILFRTFYTGGDVDLNRTINDITVYMQDCHEYYIINIKFLSETHRVVSKLCEILSNKGLIVYSTLDNNISEAGRKIKDDIGIDCSDEAIARISAAAESPKDLNFILVRNHDFYSFNNKNKYRISEILTNSEIENLNEAIKKEERFKPKFAEDYVKVSSINFKNYTNFSDLIDHLLSKHQNVMEDFYKNNDPSALASLPYNEVVTYSVLDNALEFYYTFKECAADCREETFDYWCYKLENIRTSINMTQQYFPYHNELGTIYSSIGQNLYCAGKGLSLNMDALKKGLKRTFEKLIKENVSQEEQLKRSEKLKKLENLEDFEKESKNTETRNIVAKIYRKYCELRNRYNNRQSHDESLSMDIKNLLSEVNWQEVGKDVIQTLFDNINKSLPDGIGISSREFYKLFTVIYDLNQKNK